MPSNSSPNSEPSEYIPLPEGAQNSPEWRAARELAEHAELAKGRLELGCCMIWLSDGGYLMTGLPPMGDVRGGSKWMVIYTPEYLVRLEGENLHLLAWQMKRQGIDHLGVTEPQDEVDDAMWAVTSITATARDED